jgi:hypothetical protein
MIFDSCQPDIVGDIVTAKGQRAHKAQPLFSRLHKRFTINYLANNRNPQISTRLGIGFGTRCRPMIVSTQI